MADSKISDLAAISSLSSTDEMVVASSGASKKITGANLRSSLVPIGGSSLVYSYTVTGSDKASIDTGVDAANAGTNDWTNGDVLEVFAVIKTDEVGARTNFDVTVNNDTGSNYDQQALAGTNSSVGAAASAANTKWTTPALDAHGSGGTANYPAIWRMSIPGYADTTFYKVGESATGLADGTASSDSIRLSALGYRSTSAITRLKISAQGSAKFKVGTKLLIYKRLAS